MSDCMSIQPAWGIVGSNLDGPEMLKLSLIVMFVVSLATLSFASSFVPVPDEAPIQVAAAEPHPWIVTFE